MALAARSKRDMSARFHLAVPVFDLDAARHFYGTVLGCPEGRSSERWIDFNLAGHQLVCHCVEAGERQRLGPVSHSQVDGHAVPVPHFGLVLDLAAWESLRDRLEQQDVQFEIAPTVRFAGTTGEQRTLFLKDPSGNALEFKGFADIDGELFRTDP